MPSYSSSNNQTALATPTPDATFQSQYLQRLTSELSGDIDKIRTADDFKTDSVSFLVHALQQGAGQFTKDEQRRVVDSLTDGYKNNVKDI